MLKTHLEGCSRFWSGKDVGWNIFDVFIVCFAIVDVVMTRMVSAGNNLNNLTIFRTARLARLTRMMRLLRLLRLRIFKELALMVKGVIAGLRTLFWAIVLLVFVTYAVGVILRQTVGEDHVEMNDPYKTVLFNSISWSMATTFRCFTTDC